MLICNISLNDLSDIYRTFERHVLTLYKDCFKLISNYMSDYDRESENRCSLAKNIIKRGWTDVDFANEIYAIIIKQVLLWHCYKQFSFSYRHEIIPAERNLLLVSNCLPFVFSFLSQESNSNSLYEIGSNKINLIWIQCFILVINYFII